VVGAVAFWVSRGDAPTSSPENLGRIDTAKPVTATTPPTLLDGGLDLGHSGATTPVQGDAHDEVLPEDYKDQPIPPDQFDVLFPPSESGLGEDARMSASNIATALVTAQVTGVGRDRFPGYFPSLTDPDLPYATNFVVEFSTAQAVPDDPSLVRTITLWKGIGTGNVPFRQVRIANYLSMAADGSLTPIPTGKLPAKIGNSDSWLSGISILG